MVTRRFLAPALGITLAFASVCALPQTREEGPAAESGLATVYAATLAGQPTASGESYDPGELTAAHRTLPLGTRLKLTHVGSGVSVVVRVNDRWGGGGGRLVNVSERAARELGIGPGGTAEVRMEVEALGDNARARRADDGQRPDGARTPQAVMAEAAGFDPAARVSEDEKLALCQREAGVLGLSDAFHAMHVKSCVSRKSRAKSK